MNFWRGSRKAIASAIANFWTKRRCATLRRSRKLSAMSRNSESLSIHSHALRWKTFISNSPVIDSRTKKRRRAFFAQLERHNQRLSHPSRALAGGGGTVSAGGAPLSDGYVSFCK